MSGPCYYHPQLSAVAQCVQCGMPICEECRDTVNDKAVCRKCVGAIRAKLEQQMAASPAASSAVAPAAPPPAVWPPPPAGAASYGVPAAPAAPGVGRLLGGFALAAVLGIVGAVLWVVITFAAHFELSLVAIGVGWLCGFGALKGVGQGGRPAAIIGAVTALGATLIGAFAIAVLQKGGGTPGLFEWFCVAVGTYEGYIVPTRAARRGQ